uniref:Uncharacterized protein n=1 Tax=Mycena chlorophos TaxID=658473 RepID=A0ABQ0M4R7_MYCCL|nr:predicted protein [Mycena chlorophos]
MLYEFLGTYEKKAERFSRPAKILIAYLLTARLAADAACLRPQTGLSGSFSCADDEQVTAPVQGYPGYKTSRSDLQGIVVPASDSWPLPWYADVSLPEGLSALGVPNPECNQPPRRPKACRRGAIHPTPILRLQPRHLTVRLPMLLLAFLNRRIVDRRSRALSTGRPPASSPMPSAEIPPVPAVPYYSGQHSPGPPPSVSLLCNLFNLDYANSPARTFSDTWAKFLPGSRVGSWSGGSPESWAEPRSHLAP